jgi:hypothetical protein
MFLRIEPCDWKRSETVDSDITRAVVKHLVAMQTAAQKGSEAKRRSILSPQRFGRVAQRTEVPAVWPPMGVPQQPSSNAQAYPSTMLRAL